ncbi:MAG: SulP family inorganic anion transporter [Saprospiraceae bacterium]
MQLIDQIFPIKESLKGYSKSIFRKDFIAGLTVTIMLVPQGMAYALLTGVPPIYGLYSSLIPLFLYAILGTSRQMSIGPVAISALLVLGGVSELATPETPEYISLVITVGLLVGLAQMLLGLLRLGFLVNFLSHPVIIGFTSAAAIIIAISQLKDVLGFPIPRELSTTGALQYAFQHIGETNMIAVALCIGAIALMFILKAINKNIPGALIVVVLGVLLSWGLDLSQYGLNIIAGVPEGLPIFQLPDMGWENIQLLGETTLTVTIICIVESLAIAKVLEAKHQDYTIRPDQELFALGISKIGGAFFQSIPTSGSFSRSAINNEAGAKTTVASIITVFLIALTLLFLTPLFYYLPRAILAAIIMLAVKSLFDLKEGIYLWHTHKEDFWMMLITFIVTLIVSIPVGIFTGVLLSIGAILYHSTHPHIAVLGKIEGTNHYRNVKRFDDAIELDNKIIMRFDDQLYFANASFFKDSLKEIVQNANRPIRYFYLDASDIHKMDSSGLHALEEIYSYLKQQNIILCICNARGPIRDMLFKSGLMETIGKENQFLNVHTAYLFHSQGADGQRIPSEAEDAVQTDFD